MGQYKFFKQPKKAASNIVRLKNPISSRSYLQPFTVTYNNTSGQDVWLIVGDPIKTVSIKRGWVANPDYAVSGSNGALSLQAASQFMNVEIEGMIIKVSDTGMFNYSADYSSVQLDGSVKSQTIPLPANQKSNQFDATVQRFWISAVFDIITAMTFRVFNNASISITFFPPGTFDEKV